MNKRAIGAAYEKAVGEYLLSHGYLILEYNFYSRMGEIDIVARDGEYLVFVEVKYRKDGEAGGPLEAVGHTKQRRISRAAQYYCLTHGYGMSTPCRFDVAAVQGNRIEVVKNAFEFCLN